MTRTKAALLFVLTVVAVHVAMRWAGMGEHAAVLAGMPRSSASLVLGPMYVLSYFAAVIVAPIVGLATLFAILFKCVAGPRTSS